MVVFLLCLIVAVLLIGADAVKGFALGVAKIGGLFLLIALIAGLISDIPQWVWTTFWVTIGVLLLALVIGLFWLSDVAGGEQARADADRDADMRASGRSEDEIRAAQAFRARAREEHSFGAMIRKSEAELQAKRQAKRDAKRRR